MDLVLKFLKEKIKLNFNDKIVIGVSAGPDSMFLLDLLIKLRKEINYTIIVAHINHKVRIESEEEAEFLETYCIKNNVIFEKKDILKYEHKNFHAYAREFRYKFYDELINKYNANYLMTAHHGDDLMETILMRLTRGSTINGYSGISLITNMNNYKIVRPLLYMTKDEIKNYNDLNNILYYIDKSNDSNKYTRNRYRKEILPFLKNENENVHLKFLKFSQMLEDASKYIEKDINDIYIDIYKDNELDIIKFNNYDLFIKRLIIERLLKEKYISLENIDDKNIESLINLINNNKTGSELNLPNNLIARINYNYLEINNKKEISDYYLKLEDGLVISNGMRFFKINNNENGNDTLHLDSSLIKLPLYVRNKKNGDFIELKGTDGKKLVSDIFIDCKIDREDRKLYPIVVDSNDKIIWIPKLKKSKYDSKNNKNCDIIFKCL